MFDVVCAVCAVFSSFQLLGPWFVSIGLTEADPTRLLLLLLLLAAAGGGGGGGGGGDAGLAQGSVQPLPASCVSA